MTRECTPEQWEEWIGELRGRYSFHTMNRVGLALLETALIISERYKYVHVMPKTDWTFREIPTPAQLRHYLTEIEKIREVVGEIIALPPLPENMNDLTHTAANNIEMIMLLARELIEQMGLIFVQSGTVQCGFNGPHKITGR
jgi:hypothetical protein